MVLELIDLPLGKYLLTVSRIIEGANANKYHIYYPFHRFLQSFRFHTSRKYGRDTHAYGIPDEIISAIMIAYINTKSIVRTDDGDTEFIKISGGVLQGDTLAPFLFIICLDYVLKRASDRNNDLGFTLIDRKIYPAILITDVYYSDDLAILTDKTNEAILLLHKIEHAEKEMGLSINTGKTKFISINQGTNEVIKSQNGMNIKEVSNFKYH